MKVKTNTEMQKERQMKRPKTETEGIIRNQKDARQNKYTERLTEIVKELEKERPAETLKKQNMKICKHNDTHK